MTNEIKNLQKFIQENKELIIPKDITNKDLGYYHKLKELKAEEVLQTVVYLDEQELKKTIDDIMSNKYEIKTKSKSYIPVDWELAKISLDILSEITANEFIVVYTTYSDKLNDCDKDIIRKVSGYKSLNNLRAICDRYNIYLDEFVTNIEHLKLLYPYNNKVTILQVNDKNKWQIDSILKNKKYQDRLNIKITQD